MRLVLFLVHLVLMPSYSESVGDCSHLSGYNYNGGFCWKYYSTPTDWYSAEALCEGDGAHLASINSAQEQAYAQRERTWIGLFIDPTGTGTTWIDEAAVSYTNWDTSQPDFLPTSCAEFGESTAFRWEDDDCYQHRPYVCKAAAIASATTTIPSGLGMSEMVQREGCFMKVPGGVTIDGNIVYNSSVHIVSSAIECAEKCLIAVQCVHFIMSEDGDKYLCETYTTMSRPPSATPPNDNYQKINC